MPPRSVALLILTSVLNTAILLGSFIFGVFATDPNMQDATMRIGYYVLNGIVVAAFVGIVAPWILALKKHHKGAIFFATLPALLTCIAVLSFLTLDSWLRRTFPT